MSPTNHEIASNYDLWEEYIDPYGLDSQQDFEDRTLEERLVVINECFPDADTVSGIDNIYASIYRYVDGFFLAEVTMPSQTWTAYIATSQDPEGLIQIADLAAMLPEELPPACYTLAADTVVYLMQG